MDVLLHSRQLGANELAHPRFRVGKRDLALVEFREKRFLREIVLIHHARLALQHAPGFAALDREEYHLARDGIELNLPRLLALDVAAEVRDEAAVIRIKHATMDHVILRDEEEHIVEQREFRRLFLLDRFYVL